MQRTTKAPKTGQRVHVYSSLWKGPRPGEVGTVQPAAGIFLVDAKVSADPKTEPELYATLAAEPILFTTPAVPLHAVVPPGATVSLEHYGGVVGVAMPDGTQIDIRFAVFEAPAES